MDTNKIVLEKTLAIADLETSEGRDLSQLIQAVADIVGANEVIGCAPRTYHLNNPITEEDSLHRLYLEDIMPSAFLEKTESPPNTKNVFVQSLPYFFRYNLYEGEITVNDIHNIISDNDVLYRVAHSLRGGKLQRLVSVYANGATFLNESCPAAVYTTQDSNKEIDPNGSHELFVSGREVDVVTNILAGIGVRYPLKELVNGGDTTIIQIWIDFIQNSWECGLDRGYNEGESAVGSSSGTVPKNTTVESPAANVDGYTNSEPIDKAPKRSIVAVVLGAIVGGALLLVLIRSFPAYMRRKKRKKMRAQNELVEHFTLVNDAIEII